MYRVIGNLKILKQMDLIGRTSELARLFGIEFFSVLSRGTQVGKAIIQQFMEEVGNMLMNMCSVRMQITKEATVLKRGTIY